MILASNAHPGSVTQIIGGEEIQQRERTISLGSWTGDTSDTDRGGGHRENNNIEVDLSKVRS